MTNDDKDLRPCKICNKKHNEMQEYGIGPCNPSTWFVRVCLNCGWQPEASKNKERANEAWNSRATPQQPSEPLKELDEKAILMVLDQCCPVSMDKMAKEMIAQILWNKFGQPSEKKALSVEEIVELLKGHFGIREYNRMVAIAQAIHSALPARKEVKWPEKMDEERFYCEDGDIYRGREWNECRDACIKAYESAMPAQREVR